MRIALIGTGHMGSTIARLAAEYGHELSAVFSSSMTADSKSAEDQLSESDVAIDFSAAAAVRSNVDAAVRMNVPIVVGTTGWNAELEAVRSIVRSGNGTMLFAPNFSLGVALLAHAVRAVTPLLNHLEEFDPYISETHHVRKADSPSGTALHLGDILLEGLDRKTDLLTGNTDGPIEASTLQVTSSRAGSVFGIHEVHIDGPDDHLTLMHSAKNRVGFARGALIAAEWLIGRTGFHTLDDMLREWGSRETAALSHSS